MKIALLQTMYDEHENVLHNINIVQNNYKDALFLVTHSFDKESIFLDKIRQLSYYNRLDNLAGSVDKLKLPALSLARNYSDLFSRLYTIGTSVDLVVALLGDTKIIDTDSFKRRYNEMLSNNYRLYVCQAKEQLFWSSKKVMNRLQTEDVYDFMPQLFFVDGSFAFNSNIFNSIVVTNEYTTEQCLGDAALTCVKPEEIGRLNKEATYWLSYTDGIVWQCMTNGKPGRP